MTQCWIFLIFSGCQTLPQTVMNHISSMVIFLASSLVIHLRIKMTMTDMMRNNLQKIFELRKLDVSVLSRVSQPWRPDCLTCKSLSLCWSILSWKLFLQLILGDEYSEKILSKFSTSRQQHEVSAQYELQHFSTPFRSFK